MIQPNKIALVSETKAVGTRDLSVAAAALQVQVTRDFMRHWNVAAAISAFATLDDVPTDQDYWHISIEEGVPDNAEGVHQDDTNGQPFALVAADASWTIHASHECLEMLADPYLMRFVHGESLVSSQGRVAYLVEVCDPCEGVSYEINGIPVSDFYFPNYFDATLSPGARYSFDGAIAKPMQVLEDGYLTWVVEASGELWKASNVAGDTRFARCDTAVSDEPFRLTSARLKALLRSAKSSMPRPVKAAAKSATEAGDASEGRSAGLNNVRTGMTARAAKSASRPVKKRGAVALRAQVQHLLRGEKHNASVRSP